MFGEVLVVAFVVYLMGDTVSRGKLGAVMRGTGKGVAKTGYRAAREGARKSGESYSTFLRSDAAPLRRTRKTARKVGRPVGRGARATWAGAREGASSELAKLSEQLERARADAERARAEKQDPVRGAQRGRFGHSFDVAPALDPEVAVTGVQPRSEADTWQNIEPLRAVDGSLVTVCEAVAAGAYGDPDGACAPPPPPVDPAAGRSRPLARRPYPRTFDGRPLDPGDPGFSDGPARPRGGTQQEEIIMSAGTMTNGSGGPSVRVESVPGFIAAVGQLATLASQISEQGVALGISSGAQAGLEDAIDILRGVATSVASTYKPLVEGADATPQGAEAVTVGKARTE